MIGNYGISQDNTHRQHELIPVYHFRYRWVQKVMFKLLDKKYPILFTTHITYNDRVWIGGDASIISNTSFIISLIGHMVWVFTQIYLIVGQSIQNLRIEYITKFNGG